VSSLRPPNEADVPAAVAIVAEYWPEAVDDARIARDWTSPRVDLARDARIGEGAYVLVEDIGERRAWVDLHGRNASEALDWAERRAAELGASRIFSGGWATNRPVLDELERRDYVLTRHSSRMEIELRAPQEHPRVPEGIEVRTFRPGDERTVYDVHAEAFRDMWEPIEETYDEWAHWHLQAPQFVPELWFLATEGADACGVALCHPHATMPDLGWIDILAVRRPWRRRGIGCALLLHAFQAFRERGLERAGLGVDAESVTGAHALYESVGMRATQRFDIYEKAVS
jgi:ribosomal protein S18 acetylase RimI-like enzyme